MNFKYVPNIAFPPINLTTLFSFSSPSPSLTLPTSESWQSCLVLARCLSNMNLVGVSRLGRVALTSVLFLPSMCHMKQGQCLLGAQFPIYKVEIKSCACKCREKVLATVERLLDWFQRKSGPPLWLTPAAWPWATHSQGPASPLVPTHPHSLCNFAPPGKSCVRM